MERAKVSKKSIFMPVGVVSLALFLILLTLLYCGIIHINNPDQDMYPIAGVDVSTYQGVIDWETLSEQKISFAFIKATEGSSMVDLQFEDNWKNASKTDLRIGAYHFFSFESSGEKQAELFCNTVKSVADMLPPVIDVEYYGKFKSENDINIPDVKNELRSLVDALTAEYGTKPIIYASKEAYDTIIKNDFSDCDLWLRSVYSSVPRDVEWTFWQYSSRHRLEGYNGREYFIDMNVFNGSADEFAIYPN